MAFVTILERQRRARVTEALRKLLLDFQAQATHVSPDKATVIEATITYMRHLFNSPALETNAISGESFRSGYINAVSDMSRVMAGTPGVNVAAGKVFMESLASEYNRLMQLFDDIEDPPLSPASSGYHSDRSRSPTPENHCLWRPW